MRIALVWVKYPLFAKSITTPLGDKVHRRRLYSDYRKVETVNIAECDQI